ncbi:DUF444 family protein [Paenibacillus sp. N1-5-1-14]|uniref:DUF444 family protein n=1 Tax=Paenibacillus radicibacter TaxID=2972488 RepID=UPI0021593F72|nr:DUF444 family protein [Paenibacillus radicibacter]MCR8641439.1 DUF444 family protein [Paenibacillus radicibacter]
MNKQFKCLNDEQLLELYAKTFGSLKFESTDSSLNDNLVLYKNEIIERMNQTPVEAEKLRELLTDVQVVMSGKRQEDVFKLLREDISFYPEMLKNNAKIIVAMDRSGSMGSWEKYMGRSIMLWIEKLLLTLYSNVEKNFIGYDTEAHHLDEEDLYSIGETGGTICSSGLAAVNELINNYDYETVDTYVFLIGDGDNLSSDNDRSIRIMKDITRKAERLYYFEMNNYVRFSTLASGIKQNNFTANNFRSYIVQTNEDVYSIIKSMFDKQKWIFS